MVVVLKTPNPPHESFIHYYIDLLVVSFDFVLDSSCPLRVEGLVIDASCGLPLLEPYRSILLKM